MSLTATMTRKSSDGILVARRNRNQLKMKSRVSPEPEFRQSCACRSVIQPVHYITAITLAPTH